MDRLKNYAVILASGKGKRFGGDIPKQFLEISGKTVLERSIEVFEYTDEIDGIITVITPEYIERAREIIEKNAYKKVFKILPGGKERKDSSYIGVNAIEENEANVLIHDCARPLIPREIVRMCIRALKTYEAAAVAVKTTDTVIKVKDNVIEEIPERRSLMNIQTPQCFKLSLIKKAHELSKNDNNFTDDCGLVVKYDLSKVHIIEGHECNIKITFADDIYMAERIFNRYKLIGIDGFF